MINCRKFKRILAELKSLAQIVQAELKKEKPKYLQNEINRGKKLFLESLKIEFVEEIIEKIEKKKSKIEKEYSNLTFSLDRYSLSLMFELDKQMLLMAVVEGKTSNFKSQLVFLPEENKFELKKIKTRSKSSYISLNSDLEELVAFLNDMIEKKYQKYL